MADSRLSELENLVVQIQTAGKDWVKAKLRADQLEEDKKPFLAALKNSLDDGHKKEARIDREAEGSIEYRMFIKNMVLARADMLDKKVRYESLNQLFEAKRSERAFERETVRKGIFAQGG